MTNDDSRDADGTPRIIVAVPGTDLKFMTYPGPGQPRLGQQIDIEEVSNPLALWKTYRLKDASE